MLHIRQDTPSDVSNYRTGSPTRSSPSLHQVMLSRNEMRSLCTVGLLRQCSCLRTQIRIMQALLARSGSTSERRLIAQCSSAPEVHPGCCR